MLRVRVEGVFHLTLCYYVHTIILSLHHRLLCSEALPEQQWSPDLSRAQRVVYDLLPLH